jgi:2',3'-cyclic-nucleotide 2'-phosphodiesterase (5'-nucleotidase family)
VSPSGKVFPASSATAKVAAIVLAAQPEMADLKKVIGYAEEELPHMKTEGSLSNWFVDVVMDKVSELSGKKIDVGICNFGGIRKAMPKGDVLLDDIQSMFPFKNYLVHLEVKGNELRKVFRSMAQTRFQAVGGVKVEVVDRKLNSVLVGGEPLDDEKVYNVATISFLLTGGDGLKLEDNAMKINSYDVMIMDAVLEYIENLTKEGKAITSTDEPHVIIR